MPFSYSRELDQLWKEVDQLIDDEQYIEAEKRLRSSLSENPQNADIMTRIGEVLAYQHRESAAETMFRQVLSVAPTHEPAVSFLGRLLDNSLRISEAEDLFRKALDEAPDSHCVREDLCRLLHDEGRAEEALREARDHQAQFKSTPEAYNALRYVLVRREEELEDELVESECAPELYIELAKNVIVQYDVLTSLESVLNARSAEDLDDDIVKDVQGDIFRIIGELEDIRGQLRKRKGKTPPEISRRIEDIVNDAKRRRELL